jgi:hypothetical protein
LLARRKSSTSFYNRVNRRIIINGNFTLDISVFKTIIFELGNSLKIKIEGYQNYSIKGISENQAIYSLTKIPIMMYLVLEVAT